MDRGMRKRPAPSRFADRPPKGAQPSPGGLPRPSVAPAQLLYGVHPVTQAWLNPERSCRHFYATRAALEGFAPVLATAGAQGLQRPAPIVAEREAIDRLLPSGAVHQGLALDAEPLPEATLDDVLIAAGDGRLTLVLLDQVTDPHNVGAILRSAAAFGAKGVIVQARHAPEVTGVLAKAASGAVDVIPILRETNLARAIDQLREADCDVLGLAEEADSSIEAADLANRVVLALGAEGEGLRRLVAEKCSLLASLPTCLPIGSLNVSNAAAVALYEIARRQAQLSKPTQY
jgi:23S rRNA (guanosine2251-2'-O)-methyltransferase